MSDHGDHGEHGEEAPAPPFVTVAGRCAHHKLTQLDAIPTGQTATCWITTADGTLYASNAGSGTELVLRGSGKGTLALLATKTTDAGTTDPTASPDGQYLYVQAGGGGRTSTRSGSAPAER